MSIKERLDIVRPFDLEIAIQHALAVEDKEKQKVVKETKVEVLKQDIVNKHYKNDTNTRFKQINQKINAINQNFRAWQEKINCIESQKDKSRLFIHIIRNYFKTQTN